MSGSNDIVIVGGGIIGSAIAFYLTELGIIDAASIHIIESSPELVASASGYAGGFLAKDWFSASSAALGALSFDMHAELAEKYNGSKQWGYSKTTSYSLTSSKTAKRGEDWLTSGSRASVGKVVYENKQDGGPLWLKRADGDGLDVIGEDTSAQVDPRRLTMFLLNTAIKRGVKLHQEYNPSKVNVDAGGSIESIDLRPSTTTHQDSITIPCRQLVIAAGAWTPRIFQGLFPNDKREIPISSLAGHSLLLRTDKWVDGDEIAKENSATSAAGGGCHAIYSSTYTKGVGEWSPEIYSRVGGEIYIAGLNDPKLPLPQLVTDRVLEPQKLAVVIEEARRLVGVDKVADLEVIRQGLCFRPVTSRGTPIIDEVRQDVYIAAGHGPWGISMSLGTGKVVAERIGKLPTSADITGLSL